MTKAESHSKAQMPLVLWYINILYKTNGFLKTEITATATSARDCKRLQLDWMILRTRLVDGWYTWLMIGLFSAAVLFLGWRVCWRGIVLTFWRAVLTIRSGEYLCIKNSTVSSAFFFLSKSVSLEHRQWSLRNWEDGMVFFVLLWPTRLTGL